MQTVFEIAFFAVLFGGIGFFVGVLRQAERKWRYVVLGLAVAACLLSPWIAANGQEVVHARAGEVVAVNATSKVMILKASNGETVVFQQVTGHEPWLSFNKAIREKTVPVAGFNKIGSNVVVFYYGSVTPTAVALKDLGADPLKRSTGSVAKFDRHEHSLMLATEAAEPQKLALDEDTVLDTPEGVVRLSDYKPAKGEQIRCVSKPESQVAVLLAPQ